VFPGVEVVVRKKPNDYGENDTLEFINSKNGEVVLEVGTDNSDDYYPCFVANFYPEKI